MKFFLKIRVKLYLRNKLPVKPKHWYTCNIKKPAPATVPLARLQHSQAWNPELKNLLSLNPKKEKKTKLKFAANFPRAAACKCTRHRIADHYKSSKPASIRAGQGLLNFLKLKIESTSPLFLVIPFFAR